MSIFTNWGKWGLVPETPENRQTRLSECETLTKYFNLICKYPSGYNNQYTIEDTFSPKITGISISYYCTSSYNKLTIGDTILSFKDDMGNEWRPNIYILNSNNNDILVFGDMEINRFVAFTFIHSKTADVIPTDAEICVVKIIDTANSVDKTIIYSSNTTSDGEILTPEKYGFCDKYILTPFVFKGCIANGSYHITGGRDDFPNFMSFKVGGKTVFSITQNICIPIDI